MGFLRAFMSTTSRRRLLHQAPPPPPPFAGHLRRFYGDRRLVLIQRNQVRILKKQLRLEKTSVRLEKSQQAILKIQMGEASAASSFRKDVKKAFKGLSDKCEKLSRKSKFDRFFTVVGVSPVLVPCLISAGLCANSLLTGEYKSVGEFLEKEPRKWVRMWREYVKSLRPAEPAADSGDEAA